VPGGDVGASILRAVVFELPRRCSSTYAIRGPAYDSLITTTADNTAATHLIRGGVVAHRLTDEQRRRGGLTRQAQLRSEREERLYASGDWAKRAGRRANAPGDDIGREP
jgi:hypothetical protein